MVVRENVGQRVDVLELGREACADDVVAGRHALNDVAGNVCVDVVGLEIHGLARAELDVVEEEKHEEADVLWELGIAAGHEFAEFVGRVDAGAWSDVAGLGKREEVLGFFRDKRPVGLHERAEGGFQGLFGLVYGCRGG